MLREGALGGRLFCKPSCALLNLSTISQCDGSAIAAEKTPELSKTPAVRTGGRTHGEGYWPSSSRSYPDRRDEGRSLPRRDRQGFASRYHEGRGPKRRPVALRMAGRSSKDAGGDAGGTLA